jgi:hypothetical protein
MLGIMLWERRGGSGLVVGRENVIEVCTVLGLCCRLCCFQWSCDEVEKFPNCKREDI